VLGTKKCLLSLQVERDALSTWLEELEIMLDSIDHVKEKLINREINVISVNNALD
jgi:hypothetical protein